MEIIWRIISWEMEGREWGIRYKARDIKERIKKWDLIKIKSFCMAKENSTKLQRVPTVWENIFANDTSDKGLISNAFSNCRFHPYFDGLK